MDRPAFRGFVMMHVMGVGQQGVHIVWQYTNGMGIWQGITCRCEAGDTCAALRGTQCR